MSHFFVSYTGQDVEWAEWIAWVLEEEGHTVTLQKWDFRPGANFVVEMQNAATTADRTIAVLSPEYLKSGFATSEWVAAFAEDPTGKKFKLVPVRVRACNVDGLWKALIYIDLVGLDEAAAKKRLVDGVGSGRAKPLHAPRFPGASVVPHTAVQFPGAAERPSTIPSATGVHIPKVRRTPTDLDQRRFVQQGFAKIKEHFESGLAQIKSANAAIDTDLTVVSATEFHAEVFVSGKSRSRCKVWLGGMLRQNEISYAEGTAMSSGAINDSIAVNIDGGDLTFRSLIGMGFGRSSQGLDISRLTSEQAADYLWRRFVAPLES